MAKVKKIALLICSLVIALAPWAKVQPSWDALLQPQNLFVGLPIIAAIVIAWLGQSPITPKK